MATDSSTSLRDGLVTGGIGITTGFVIGLLTHTVLRRFRPHQSSDDALSDQMDDLTLETTTLQSINTRINEEHKLVLCVRTDLKMQRGKIAAQVGHATLGAYKRAERKNPVALRQWENHAQPKIALQIGSEAQAHRLEKEAKARGLVTYIVYDAGRTQIAAGSMTVLAVGPGPVSLVNQVTGSLKLL